MATDERSRHELYQRLEQVLGTEPADTMMELLPPVGWADVATKHDLEVLRVAMTREIELLRVTTRKDLDATGQAIETLRVETKYEFAAVRAEMHGGFDSLRAEMQGGLDSVRAEMHGGFDSVRAEFSNQTRQLVLTLVPVMVALNGVAVALAALLR